MKTLNMRLMKKIAHTVRFETTEQNGNKKYSVYQKNFRGEWIMVMSTTRLAKALHRKHNAYLRVIYNIGKCGFILERRRKRALTSKQKRELIERFKEKS